MSQHRDGASEHDPLDFLAGGGEMGERIRASDWANNPLGPVAGWPQSLRTAVSICLSSRFPTALWIGAELRLLYNDAWRPILGRSRHPHALSSPGRDAWPEAWPILGPVLGGVLANGQVALSDDQLLMLERSGHLEEAYFTSSFSPIRAETGEVAGVFAAAHETTPRVIGERRLRTLRELAAAAPVATTASEACRRAVAALAADPADVPFALLYLVDEDGRRAHLCESTPLPSGQPLTPPQVDLTAQSGDAVWPLATVTRSGHPLVLPLDASFGPPPSGPWPLPPRQAVALPLKSSGRDRVAGVLVLGVNPCRALDDEHRGFHDLVAAHVAAALANAVASEEERRRAAALAALAEADRRKDEFLATLAHELRNPLAPLRNGLEVMRLARADAGARDEALAMMERQLGQMVRIIDDLLDVSRISRGKLALRRERVDLAKVLRQAVETSRPLIEAGRHELTVRLPADPVFVDADATRLAQVFANLLNNAAKYTEPGGRILLSLEHQGAEAMVAVRDTGVGIPAAMLPRVFEMFVQVEHSLERAQGGLGIGLALVRGLVGMHGGAVEANSEGHGQGSEFVVRLPVAPPPVGRGAAPAGDGAARAAHRVLVVDDNDDSAASLAMLLEAMGNEARTARDGLEALEVGAAFRPDVVLLDIGLPRLNGYEAARRIRLEPWGKGILLVAQTGWSQEEDRRQSREAGFDFHLVKPIDPAVLESVLAAGRSGV
jgi:signal transduction histidine kinase